MDQEETASASQECVRRWKLWLYTNYDCNLSCNYCVAESTPSAPRRALPLPTIRQIIDETRELPVEEVFFTGGEPFVLPEIYTMLAYAAERLKTTVLTNAMLLKGRRLEKLLSVAADAPDGRLTIQVSLDGGRAEHHDAYRGPGTWAKTVDGIRRLKAAGLYVRLSTTETPANSAHLDEICALHDELGIPHADHIVRPLARRGFSQEGMPVDKSTLEPELTINVEGVYWHPLSTDADMLVSERIFPLSSAIDCLEAALNGGANGRSSFT